MASRHDVTVNLGRFIRKRQLFWWSSAESLCVDAKRRILVIGPYDTRISVLARDSSCGVWGRRRKPRCLPHRALLSLTMIPLPPRHLKERSIGLPTFNFIRQHIVLMHKTSHQGDKYKVLHPCAICLVSQVFATIHDTNQVRSRSRSKRFCESYKERVLTDYGRCCCCFVDCFVYGRVANNLIHVGSWRIRVLREL